MTELSLNILDIANNSVKAKATLIEIVLKIETQENKLTIIISDNGCGMSEEFLKKVTDPFSTTRTTRKVGMGLPLFKMAAEMAEGKFGIVSKLGAGTTVTADFKLNHIDRMPLGDLASTLTVLIGADQAIDYILDYNADGRNYRFDTRQVREMMEGVPLTSPEIINFIGEMIKENIEIVNGGLII